MDLNSNSVALGIAIEIKTILVRTEVEWVEITLNSSARKIIAMIIFIK